MLSPCCVQFQSTLAGTTWSRPPFLPDGWECGLHEGRLFFQQPSTGLTRWEPPEGSSVRPPSHYITSGPSLACASQLGCDQWRLGQETPLGAPPPMDTQDSAAEGETTQHQAATIRSLSRLQDRRRPPLAVPTIHSHSRSNRAVAANPQVAQQRFHRRRLSSSLRPHHQPPHHRRRQHLHPRPSPAVALARRDQLLRMGASARWF